MNMWVLLDKFKHSYTLKRHAILCFPFLREFFFKCPPHVGLFYDSEQNSLLFDHDISIVQFVQFVHFSTVAYQLISPILSSSTVTIPLRGCIVRVAVKTVRIFQLTTTVTRKLVSLYSHVWIIIKSFPCFPDPNITMEDNSEDIDILTADESEETLQSHIFPYDPGNHFQVYWIYF